MELQNLLHRARLHTTSWPTASLHEAESSDAIRAAARAGQFTQASRSWRASRNTSASARARSTSSPFMRESLSRRSCDFSTSLEVFACRKVVPVPGDGGAIPCSRRVSPTAATAVSGTGFISGGTERARLLRRIGHSGAAGIGRGGIDGAVGVQHQSSRGLRLLDRAAREPDRAAYSRSLMPCMMASKIATI